MRAYLCTAVAIHSWHLACPRPFGCQPRIAPLSAGFSRVPAHLSRALASYPSLTLSSPVCPQAGGGVTFDSAPTCNGPPGPNNSTKDQSGRLWGTLPQGGSCAYKDASGKPIAAAGQGSTATANSGATAGRQL